MYVVFGGPNLQAFNLANIATAGPGGVPAGFVINGPQPPAVPIPGREPFGTALGGGGAGATSVTSDVNGDGVDDIILGESDQSNGTSLGAGDAWVIFGKADGNPVNLTNASTLGSEGYEIEGPSTGAGLGQSVTMYGDQNGDGLADMAVAAPGVNCSNRNNAGAVYVLYGTASTNTINLANGISPSQGYEICGNTGDLLGGTTSGHGLADIGDVSTDGVDDLAIGGDGGYVVFSQPAGSGTVDLGAWVSNRRVCPPGLRPFMDERDDSGPAGRGRDR